MRQTHNLILAALALVAAVSCNKVETPASEGTPLTIRATLGTDEGTKVGYIPDGNILKTAWDANETITVITVDGSGNVVTIDNFDYSGTGGKTVEFSGSLSSGATSDIRLLYPALEGSPYDGTHYGTSLPDGQTGEPARLIREVKIGSKIATFAGNDAFTQVSSGDTNHLGKSVVYSGTGTVTGSVLSVTVQPLSSVLCLDITLPSSAVGEGAQSVYVTAFDSLDNDYNFTPSNQWFNFFNGEEFPKFGNNLEVYLGSWTGTTQNMMYVDGTALKVYMPFIPVSGTVLGPSGGKKLKVSCSVPGVTIPDKFITLTTDTALESGKVYRLSADFS